LPAYLRRWIEEAQFMDCLYHDRFDTWGGFLGLGFF
jgi:hypothetical protein